MEQRPLTRSESIKIGQLALQEEYPEMFTELDIEVEIARMRAEKENTDAFEGEKGL